MFSRFSKYSRRLSNSWDMTSEEKERCQRKAQAALRLAGILMALVFIGLIVALIGQIVALLFS